MRTGIRRFLLSSLIVSAFPITAYASNLDFDVTPVPDTAGRIVTQMEPSSNNTGALSITNTSTKPIEVTMFPVDSINGANGGVSYTTTPAQDTWISNLPSKVSIPARKTVKVSFQVKTPSSSAVLQSEFGILLSDSAPQRISTTSAGSTNITLYSHAVRVVPVEVNMPGQAAYGITFQDANVQTKGNISYITVDGVSNSNVMIRQGLLNVSVQQNGKKIWNNSISNISLLPQKQFTFTIPFKGIPSEGNYSVMLEFRSPHLNVSRSLNFDVSSQTVQAAKNYGVITSDDTSPIKWFRNVKMMVGAGGVLLLFILCIIIVRYRRRSYVYY